MKGIKKEHPTRYGSAPDSAQGKYTTYLAGMQEGTQGYLVLKHLIDKGKITSIEAFFDYHITRLAAVVFGLRSLGIEVDTTMKVIKSKKGGQTRRYAVYTLHEED